MSGVEIGLDNMTLLVMETCQPGQVFESYSELYHISSDSFAHFKGKILAKKLSRKLHTSLSNSQTPTKVF